MLKPLRVKRGSYATVDGNDSERYGYSEIDDDEGSNHIASPAGSAPSINYSQPSFGSPESSPTHIRMPRPIGYHEPMKTISREGSVLRHPTPDLQSLQGAYVGNVERLEQTAERLSLNSDIGEELRKLRSEQKRSESRNSSIRAAHLGPGVNAQSTSRQISTGSNASNSILELNSIARSGGFSNGFLASPVGSVRSPSWSCHSPRERQVLARQSGSNPDARLLLSFHEDQPNHKTSPVSRPSEFVNHNEERSPFNRDEIPEIPSNECALLDVPKLAKGVLQRPDTAISTETYQDGNHLFENHLFEDFDGVHLPMETPASADIDAGNILTHQAPSPSAGEVAPDSRRKSLAMPPPGTENMVYYPAPVPMMLNLPQRLSKAPRVSGRDQRRSQFMESISSARNATNGQPGFSTSKDNAYSFKENKASRSVAQLPPQLRAEIFFEHKPIHQQFQLKGDSAVATLDSILDASAHAPVSAFIDHPIIGQLGSEVYGNVPNRSTKDFPAQNLDKRKSSSSLNIFKHRLSSATILDDKQRESLLSSGTMLDNDDIRASKTGDRVLSGKSSATARSNQVQLSNDLVEDDFFDALENQTRIEDEGDIETGELIHDVYTGPPTTLLAELQLRKQQQHQRGRTAATSFPNGMHSTLLQLDAVAQVQKTSRKHKQIMLAWEDPNARRGGAVNENDEDVPLGVLYPGRNTVANKSWDISDENPPLGLIAKRAMEDNEPLSQRRARLRGEPTVTHKLGPAERVGGYTLGVPGLTAFDASIDAAEETETLAQRVKRLKNPKSAEPSRPTSTDFMSEVMSSFGGLVQKAKAVDVPGETPDAEETLGQRRKRLQAERKTLSREDDAKSTNGTRPFLPTRHTLADILHAGHPNAPRSALSRPDRSIALQSKLDQHQVAMASGVGFPGATTYNNYLGGITNPLDSQATVSYVNPIAFSEQVSIDPKQRDMIDRWRESVLY
ncbi:hypothetical protein MMC19_004473 [Ptychographa xylographoides]|nr:hypothetical protein [Ptychographa xylographoides]